MSVRSAVIIVVAGLAVVTRAGGQTRTEGGWTIVGYLPKGKGEIISACLYRDGRPGLFSPQRWAAKIDEVAPGCERLRVDLRRRLIAPDVPGLGLLRGYQAGTADAYCPRGVVDNTYSPCTSALFVRLPEPGSDYAVLSGAHMRQMIDGSGLAPLLEEQVSLWTERGAQQALLAYRSEFELAQTFELMRAFETKYDGKDPDALVPKLKLRQADLQRKELSASGTAAQTRAFIEKYKEADVAGLIDEATVNLARQVDAEAKLAQIQSAAKKMQEAEAQIGYCKRASEQANATLARERRIGALSGYENKQVMHAAGQMIVSCETSLPDYYRRYRSMGGTKAFGSIQ